MESKELRIGSATFKNGNVHFVTVSDISTTAEDGLMDYLQGVPLTTENMLKCGFEQIQANEFLFDDVHIIFEDNEYCFYWGDFKTVMNWVHELQNLFFALTGDELNIRL